MRVRATLKLRNDLAVSCREKLGLSQVAVADLTGLSQQSVCAIECMRFDRIPREDIETLAAFYDVPDVKLVPIELRRQRVTNKFTVTRDCDSLDLLAAPAEPLRIMANVPMVEDDARRLIDQALTNLSFRQQHIVRMRCGLDGEDAMTFDQIGRVFRITKARAASIFYGAVNKLQRTASVRDALVGLMAKDQP